ncbi:MAG TPA: hypothetical protein VLU25_19690 [Acidobacteriota bacterium]|nr:hypothetical protein [Acidobacteriota bacterium]
MVLLLEGESRGETEVPAGQSGLPAPVLTYLRLRRGEAAPQEILDTDPLFAEAQARLGEQRLDNHEPVAGLLALQEALSLVEGYTRVLARLGSYELYSAGAYAKAAEHFGRVLDKHPRHLESLLGLGVSLHYQAHYPRSNQVLNRLIKAVDQAGDETQARQKHFRGEAFYYLAFNAYQARQEKAAWSYVQQAEEQLGGTVKALYLGGLVAYHTSRPDEARRRFNAISRRNPPCPTYYFLGKLEKERDDIERFLSMFALTPFCFGVEIDRLERSVDSASALPREDPRRSLRLSRAKSELSEYCEQARGYASRMLDTLSICSKCDDQRRQAIESTITTLMSSEGRKDE